MFVEFYIRVVDYEDFLNYKPVAVIRQDNRYYTNVKITANHDEVRVSEGCARRISKLNQKEGM